MRTCQPAIIPQGSEVAKDRDRAGSERKKEEKKLDEKADKRSGSERRRRRRGGKGLLQTKLAPTCTSRVAFDCIFHLRYLSFPPSRK